MSNEPEQTPESQSPESPQPPPAVGQPPAPGSEAAPAPAPGGQIPGAEKKLVAGILALLIGSLGIHKFYLGYTKEGVIMLVVCLVLGGVTCGLGVLIPWAVGIAEGIIYLTKSDDEFVKTYVTGNKGWF